MTDEYAREVIRDAIPLLEQLLERLKVLAATTSVTITKEMCERISTDIAIKFPAQSDANCQILTVDDQPSQEC